MATAVLDTDRTRGAAPQVRQSAAISGQLVLETSTTAGIRRNPAVRTARMVIMI